jgi:hypothetical protein
MLLFNILNDKYYLKYKYLFNYSYIKFDFINKNILYIHIIKQDEKKKICNINLKYTFEEQIYSKIVLKLKERTRSPYVDTQYLINKSYYNNNNNKYLIITNKLSIINNIYKNNNKNIDLIVFYSKFRDTNFNLLKYLNDIEKINITGTIYSDFNKTIYLQFINNLKNNTEKNNISIPKNKYDFISCHLRYLDALSFTTSYKMTLEIPNIIATISMALKNIAKDGTLLLFWTIVNVNVPVIKKILSLLAYGFKNIEIIDNDINQNILIGIPEYYIKCSGYKDNISNDLINKLLDIAIETVKYNYDICDVLDYYEDYTEKNSNHSLFYNKTDVNEKKYKLTKKSISHTIHSTSSKRKSYTQKYTKSNTTNKSITTIYYIEDINIAELDKIIKDSTLQFKVLNMSNKLEGIFVGYFEMVNNLILNAIGKKKNGVMYVKKEAILQKDITNLTKIIAMFEHNKLPYNKHALKVILKKKDEIIDHFYALDKPLNYTMLQYTDRISKLLNKSAFNNFKSSKKIKKINEFSNLNEYYVKIKIAQQVKNKLLEDLNITKYTNKIPKNLQHNIDEFASGLAVYLNNKEISNNKLPVEINSSCLKLWEIFSTFNIISQKADKFKVLHLCEAPGYLIVLTRYWVEQNCEKIHNANMENYDWMANSLNPYNYDTRHKYASQFGNVFSDNYGLIKDNYDKWLWGSDNTGDITNVNNIKSIMNNVKKQWLGGSKLDLIISDGSISLNMNSLYIQKLDLAQIITVIACSSIGGNCCVKHYIPNNIYDISGNVDTINNTVESSSFFIGYLYMYYVAFDSISLYKPNTSNPNNGEFYVIGKDFKGISDEKLKNLMTILSNFTLNSCIIEKEHIPETFISQINNFLESMSNINILAIEKQNLLLTCYKNLGEDELENKYAETNKILKCNNFLDEKKIDNMIIPKYKEWVKTFHFV